MKKLLVAFASLSLPFTLTSAEAADLPRKAQMPPVIWNWTGFYLGGHIGAGWGQSDFDNGSGPVVFGNDVRTAVVSGGMQAGYNWQAPGSAWVFGTEAELSILGADGTNTCFATSNYVSSTNCRVRQSAMGSLTGRIGYAAGFGGRTLLYAKAGGAWLNEKIDMTSLDGETSQKSDRFGWTVGAGIEHAIAPAWSVKLEYDYADFGNLQVTAPAQSYWSSATFPVIMPMPGGPASVSQTMQTIKLGVNLKLGADSAARWGDVHASPLGLPLKTTAATVPAGYEVEVGGRVWYSLGRFQKDLSFAPDTTQQDKLISRLTYNTESASGEVYARVDTPSNIVIKGFIGGGNLSSGKLRDEDWLIKEGGTPYSNTLSDPVTGSISYVTADIGYDIIRDRAGKLAAFIGYNYLRDDKTAKGCAQTAGPIGYCATALPNTTLVISEKNEWHSLRIGVNGVMAITDQLQLTADAAYLPYVKFTGLDNHMLRDDEGSNYSPEGATGQGVQLEAILSYKITPSFSIGAGGRYWAMWATGTDAYANAFSSGMPYNALPVRNERYGSFLQASYTFDSAR